jgi:hypothetical protein
MVTTLNLAVLCICGAPESSPVHQDASGHAFRPLRAADQIRDDQYAERNTRPGHYAVADYRVVQIPNPAAGADWLATVPATARWRIACLQAQLVTSAVVANRVPHLVITDGQGHSVYNFPAPSNQIASTTVQYSAGTTIVTTQFDNASVLVMPYPVKLLQTWTIGTVTTAKDVGDQWSNIFLYIKEWLQF